MSVSFYSGGETTGTIGDRKTFAAQSLPQLSSAKYETTGGCGYFGEDVPELKTLDKDTVSFRSINSKKEKSSSFLGTIFAVGALAAITIGTLACAQKYNWVDKISSPKIKGWLKNSNKVTEPCYNWCKSLKNFCVENYDKILKKIKK